MALNPETLATTEIQRILEEIDLKANPEKSKTSDSLVKNDNGDFIKNFRMKPHELVAYLETVITGQKDAIRTLSTKICGHYNSIRSKLERAEDPMKDLNRIKSNVLLVGSTGVGKTMLVSNIAEHIGVPFIRVDATKFTEAGYVGGDVEDIIRDLVKKTKNKENRPNVGLAQYGIVFIDELDKLASAGTTQGPDVSRKGVQRALLTLIEDADVSLTQKLDIGDQIQLVIDIKEGKKEMAKTINTKHILFIFSGAFPGLQDLVAKRTNVNTGMGFRADIRKADEEILQKQRLLKQMKSEDFIEFGFESELIGRIPVRVPLDDLTADDLFAILKNKNSPIIRQFKEVMEAYGTEVSFNDEALQYLAQRASLENTGARGLASVFEKAVSLYEYHLSNMSIPKFSFTLPLIDGSIEPVAFLKNLETRIRSKLDSIQNEIEFKKLYDAQPERYADYIKERYKLELTFTDLARQSLNISAAQAGKTAREYCSILFSDYEAAFGQLERAGIRKLALTEEALRNPMEFFEKAFKSDRL